MKMKLKMIGIKLAGGLFLSVLAVSAQATELVTNGSFEDTTFTNSSIISSNNSAQVTGWETTSSYSFLVQSGDAGTSMNGSNGISLWDSATNGGLNAIPNSSPNGGNFLVVDGAYEMGTLYQTLNGLIAGQEYEVSFYQAAGQQYSYTGNTTEQWQVTLGGTLTSNQTVTLPNGSTVNGVTAIVGGQTQDSALMSNASHGFVNWQQETLTFTATSSSELLGFLALGTPLGEPPFVLLDGVSVQAAVIPEPETFALLAAGLLGMLFARRQQSRI